MEQFRQRVAATCHIGPLDVDEVRQYIEHRLKCAGYSGEGLFDPATIEGLFKASGGIPRRINGICDRMMLAGFLAGHQRLGVTELDEVVAELRQEHAAPTGTAAQLPDTARGTAAMPGGLAGGLMELAPGALQLSPEQADAMGQQLAALTVDQRGDQLQRMERSLLRLERVNLQTLNLLQALVAAVKKPPGSPP
jgi:hypothetical protein